MVAGDAGSFSGQALSWVRELNSSRKASACVCKVCAFCSATTGVPGAGVVIRRKTRAELRGLSRNYEWFPPYD